MVNSWHIMIAGFNLSPKNRSRDCIIEYSEFNHMNVQDISMDLSIERMSKHWGMVGYFGFFRLGGWKDHNRPQI